MKLNLATAAEIGRRTFALGPLLAVISWILIVHIQGKALAEQRRVPDPEHPVSIEVKGGNLFVISEDAKNLSLAEMGMRLGVLIGFISFIPIQLQKNRSKGP